MARKTKSAGDASKSSVRKKGRRKMRTDIVDHYVARLKPSIGDEDLFHGLFLEMTSDKAVQQPEAVGIVSALSSRMAASTSKKVAFERLLERHRSIAAFKKRAATIGSRSAA